MPFHSMAQWVALAEQSDRPLYQVALEMERTDSGIEPEALLARLAERWEVMEASMTRGLTEEVRSESGLVGAGARRLHEARVAGHTLTQVMADAIARALAVSEVNAAFGRIVAAPTAGSAGVVPGVFAAVAAARNLSRHTVVRGLVTAGHIGAIAARRASLAGSAAGCQAENGVASAMAAGAVVEMLGARPRVSDHAAAIALKNLLGLVCDPVAGRVEVPCVKRNAGAAANALAAAEMALAGIESVIPLDEVIDAMAWIGIHMPVELRETSEGGLAATPTGRRIAERLKVEVDP